MNQAYIPYLQLANQLDIKPNETLLIGSDISKLAISAIRHEKAFSPEQFINSFKQHLNKGTLLFPAFTNKMEEFNLRTALPNTGTLSVKAFSDPSFLRTSDPFHSFMVWGEYARQLVQCKNKSTFGNDSVFAFLHTHKAKMLLIDIDLQHSFTFAHYVEEMEAVKYREFKKYSYTLISYEDVKTREEILFFEKKMGVTICLNNLYEPLKEGGALTEYKLNNSAFTIIDFEKSVEIIKADIHHNGARNLHEFSYAIWFKTLLKKLM